MLPWRPASLVADRDLALLGYPDLHPLVDAAGRSSPFSREKTLTLITLPHSPCGTRSEVSLTSRAFSPKMARSSFSSAEEFRLALGGNLAHQDIVRPDLGADADDAVFVQFAQAFLADVGISRVISSGPSLVSRASTSCFSMWMEVNLSSSTRRSADDDGVFVVVAFPAHEGAEQRSGPGPARRARWRSCRPEPARPRPARPC